MRNKYIARAQQNDREYDSVLLASHNNEKMPWRMTLLHCRRPCRRSSSSSLSLLALTTETRKQRQRGCPRQSLRFTQARGANQLFASAMTTLNTHDPPWTCGTSTRVSTAAFRPRYDADGVDLPRAWSARSVSSFCVALFCKTSGSSRTV